MGNCIYFCSKLYHWTFNHCLICMNVFTRLERRQHDGNLHSVWSQLEASPWPTCFPVSIALFSQRRRWLTKLFGLVYCKDSLTLRLPSHLVFHEAKLSWLQISGVQISSVSNWTSQRSPEIISETPQAFAAVSVTYTQSSRCPQGCNLKGCALAFRMLHKTDQEF